VCLYHIGEVRCCGSLYDEVTTGGVLNHVHIQRQRTDGSANLQESYGAFSVGDESREKEVGRKMVEEAGFQDV
jgi:hypothetical protein